MSEEIIDTKPGTTPVKRRILFELFVLTAVCGLASGGLYYWRTNFLDLNSLEHNLFRAARMTILYLIIPLLYFIKLRKFRWADLGFSKRYLFYSIFFGIIVYSLALVAFIFSIGHPEFDKYFLWSRYMDPGEFIITMALIAWMAALTDIWTRGMVLMPVIKLHGIPLAILAQNIVWFTSHIYELEFLRGAMTLVNAVILTVALGLLGDLVAIKTKNIIGLCTGHIFLNLVFFSYVRII